MSSSIFERTRALHADLEELREATLDKINAALAAAASSTAATTAAASSAERILASHELNEMIDELRQCEATLLELYEDVDGSVQREKVNAQSCRCGFGFPTSCCSSLRFFSVRATELGALSGGGDTLWTHFYDTLSSIRQYHAKFPHASRLQKEQATSAARTHAHDVVDDTIEDGVGGTVGSVHFTAEESFGTRVDMHVLYDRFVNLPQHPNARSIDYLTYLELFHDFERLPREKKLKAQPVEYRKYLQSVYDYLTDYHHRIEPLIDLTEINRMIAEDFEERWRNKEVPGWFGVEATASDAAAQPGESKSAEATPATSSSTAADNASNPLYCVACAKSFAKQSVFDAHLTGKKHKKNEEILVALNNTNTSAPSTTDAASTSSTASKISQDVLSLASLENSIHQYALLLQPQIAQTREYLQKKHIRTREEQEAELLAQQQAIAQAKARARGLNTDDDAAAVDEEEEDANAPLSNPLNLPMGPDGKPIPVWLYKLHGLNLKFTCEICGDFTYCGPRNFERHFSEWRHAYGMRALGIPNTRHFAHITKIVAAQQLFEKLKREGVGAGWRADDEEEYEDEDGNVFNKKTYIELKKQGLING